MTARGEKPGDYIHGTVPGTGAAPRRTEPAAIGREVVSQKTDRAARLARTLVHYLGRIIGKERAMTAPALSRLIGAPDAGTCQPLREAAKVLLVRHGIPIVSGPGGFFIARTRQELYDYKANLESRMMGLSRDIEAINGILSRKNMLENVEPEQQALF